MEFFLSVGTGLAQSAHRQATRLTIEGSELQLRQSQEFSILCVVHNGSEAQATSYTVDTGFFSQGVKRPERKTGRSPTTTVKVIKMWICTSTPLTSSRRSA
jgi:hypothetical protein